MKVHREAWYREITAVSELNRMMAEFVRDPQLEEGYWGRLLQLAERETRVLDLAKAMEKAGLGTSFVEFLEAQPSPKPDSILEAIGYLSQNTASKAWPRVTLEELGRIPEHYRPKVGVKLKAVAWEGPGEPSLQHTLREEEVDLLQVAQGRYAIPKGWDPDDPRGRMHEWQWVDDGGYAYRDVFNGAEGPYIPELRTRWEQNRGQVEGFLEMGTRSYDDFGSMVQEALGIVDGETLLFTVDVTQNPAHRDLLYGWRNER